MALAERTQKPLAVILDNASFHRAKALETYRELLRKKIKYQRLPFRAYNPDELEQTIDKIGVDFGSEYQLTFC